MIEGVIIKQLDRVIDERGSVLHMLKITDSEFLKFGEIYFSTAYPGVIKGWHLHKQMTLNYAVIKGCIKLVLYDNRDDSPTKGILQQVFMGEKNYCLVVIPPGVYNGYKCIGTEEAIVANCATHPHTSDEIVRLEPFSDKIPYNWDIKYE